MVRGEPRQISWIVEKPGRLHGYVVGVVRGETLKARPARRRSLELPIDAREATVFEPHTDATIDDRDEVSVCKVIQDMTRSWAIDAGEDQVAIERGTVSRGLGKTERDDKMS